MGAVYEPPKKAVVRFFFQLIVDVMKTPLGHGAVMSRRYISVAFGLSAASVLVQSNVILLTGIVPKKNRIKRGPNLPCGSMAIGYSMISAWTSSPMARSPSSLAPVTLSVFLGCINIFLSMTCKCVSAVAVMVSIKFSWGEAEIGWVR